MDIASIYSPLESDPYTRAIAGVSRRMVPIYVWPMRFSFDEPRSPPAQEVLMPSKSYILASTNTRPPPPLPPGEFMSKLHDESSTAHARPPSAETF
eukprot:CAMPEP_0185038518 /NCGR_PEP_ID=MMETSP1103-20130426/34266_1 /TAXON_ID=36769 /ORGANISM="Paraphysomonas bandaiensis, Strain Caron Lab Isolate" /LENGTH=95 /DNA_ID=CAMNT_0027576985 /DNA_START=40 /DNA_END=324 /DNA_ORIENTATION=+